MTIRRFLISNRPCLHPCTLEKRTSPRQLLRSPSRSNINDDITVFFSSSFTHLYKKKTSQPHLSALPGLTVKIFGLLPLVFRNTAAVQILHEPEEGQLVEEDLRDLHQKVLPAVLQRSALKLAESVLEEEDEDGVQTLIGFKWLETKSSWCLLGTSSMPPSCLWKNWTNSLLSSCCWVRLRTRRRTEVNSCREQTLSMFSCEKDINIYHPTAV